MIFSYKAKFGKNNKTELSNVQKLLKLFKQRIANNGKLLQSR